MRWRNPAFAVVGVLLVAACVGPVSRLPDLSKDAIETERRQEQIKSIKSFYAAVHRVETVAFRIRTANVADCKERVAPQIGLYAVTPQSMPRRYRSYSGEALDLSWARPTAISVVEGSPAAKAGIATGDNIIALNDELIPVTGPRGWITDWLVRHGTAPLKVNIRHAGNDRAVTVTPVLGCAIPINYVVADDVNATTSDYRIVINSGIVALTHTDAQLAAIIGHELAHSNLGHLDKRRWNSALGWAGGTLVDAAFLSGSVSTGGAFRRAFEKAGLHAYSVGFEREADYVGAYYAARAGYDLTGTAEVWRDIGQAHPDSVQLAKTHPTTPERFLQMQAVAAEIAEKKRKHAPLVPEIKFERAEDGPAQGQQENSADMP